MTISSSNGKITDNSGDFMTVDWQAYFDNDEEYELEDYLGTDEDSYTLYLYASDLFAVIESYNISTSKFEYVTIKSVADDTDVESTAIVVEELTEENSIYAPSYGSARSDSEAYNLFDNATQTLYTVRRTSSPSNTSAYFDTVLPVMFEYKQLLVDGDYLDNVSQVVMTIPFLGSDEYPRYMSSVKSLTVWYDNGVGGESDAYSIDISTFSYDLTSKVYDTYSSYSGEVIAVTEATPAVSYSYTASTPPTLTFTAPEGKSIVKIQAEFSSDNGTYMPDGGSEISIVYGTPKNDDSTDSYSDHQFSVYLQDDSGSVEGQSDETYTVKTSSSANGFRWKAPDPFELDITNKTTSSAVYQYNIAKYNTVLTASTSTASKNKFGYQDLGSISLVNNSATALEDGYSVVISYEIDPNSNDVIKQIYFPYDPTNGLESIANIKYELTNGAKIDTTDVSSLAYETPNAYSAVNTLSIDAPEDVSFVSAEITLTSWGNLSGTATASLRGYLEDSSELDITGDETDDHKITVTIYDEYGNIATDNDENSLKTEVSVDTPLIVPTSTYANFNIDGLSKYESDGTYVDANVLTPGLASTINFQLFGGSFNSSTESLWRDIVFGIVIPDDLTLNSVTVGDFTLTYNGSTYTGRTTNEQVGGIEQVDDGVPMTQTQIDEHFGSGSGITEATIYTYKISDPDTVLYGFAVDGWTKNYFSSFTVSATITPDTTASDAIYSWDKLVAVSSSADYDTFGLLTNSGTYASTPGTAQVINNMSTESGLNIGNTDTIVVGSSDEYLAIKANPALMLHDAHIEYDGEDYYYNEYDSSSIPVLSSNDTGNIVFSVTNTIPEDSKADDEILLVYYALPTVTSAASGIIDTADFAASINSAGITVTDDSGNNIIYNVANNTLVDSQKVDLYYLEMDGTLGITADTKLEDLTELSSSYDYTKHNTLVLAIRDMDQTDTFDVSIPFTAPDYTEDDTLYVKFSGQASFYLDDSQVMFYGGYQEGTTLMANNYVSFAYSYPTWDVEIIGIATDENGVMMATIDLSDYSFIDFYQDIADGETQAVAETYDITGYIFDGYYSNFGVTTDFTFDEDGYEFTVTEDTTIYAKFITKKLNNVYWDYNYPADFEENDSSSTMLENVTFNDVYWTDEIVFPDYPESVYYTFTGAQYTIVGVERDSYVAGDTYEVNGVAYEIHEVIQNANGTDNLVLEEDVVSGTYLHVADMTAYTEAGDNEAITITGSWTTNTTYTVTYDVDGGSPSITTEDHYVEGHSVTISEENMTKTGYTFGGWTSSADDDSTVYASGEHYTMPAESVVFTAVWNNASYDIIYVVENNTVETISTEFGSTVSFIDGTNYLPTGYTFDSWEYNNTYYTTNSTDFTMPAQTITMVAVLSPISYTITYETDGGTEVATANSDYNSLVSLPTVTKDGYTFLNWTSSEVTVNNNNTFTMPASNVTVTANWVSSSYTLSFASTGDSVINSVSLDFGATYDLSVPTKTGWTFVSWLYDGVEYKESENFTFTMPVKDVTLTAQWSAISYTLSFDSDGGSEISDVSLGYEGTYTLPTPVKTGYTFKGWSNGTTTYTGKFTMPAESVSLTAVWEPIEYTVTFETNGGSSVSPQTVAYDDYATEPTEPTLTGYDFDAWYTNSYLDTEFNFADIITGDTSIYAGYTPKTITVTWNTNDGKIDDDTTNVLWSDTMSTSQIPTRYGYTFTGWYKDSGLETQVVDGSTYGENMLNDTTLTLSLYASWTKDPTYTISYVHDGSSEEITVTGEYIEGATVVITTAVPEKTGYTFESWESNYTASEDTKVYYVGNDNFTMPTNNVTFTATWTINEYSVTFDTDGGSSVSTQKVDYLETVVEPKDPTKTGYTFDGWYIGEDEFNFDSEITDVTTITAKWSINSYTLSFADTGETEILSEVLDYNADTTLQTPVKEGYTLLYWTTDGVTTYPAGSTFPMPAEDTTLTAVWSGNSYTVSYDINNGTGTVPEDAQHVIGSEITVYETSPTRSGYSFKGWVSDVDGNTYAAGSTYTITASNVTFTAKWSSNNSGGGSTSSSTPTSSDTAELNREDHFAYMNGYTNGTFAPDQNITRAETIVIFSRLLTDTMDTETTYECSFTDVTSDL